MPDHPPAPSFDATLARMFRRKGVDTLPAHLEEVFDIAVSKVQQLDIGVFRVDRLPEAFVHPDPVPKNTAFTKDGPVLVDWAGAGRGPRIASLALVLPSSWAGPRFMGGYATSVELDAEERRRTPDILMSRALIDIAFRVCREPVKVRHQVKRADSTGLRSVRKRTDALAAAALAAA